MRAATYGRQHTGALFATGENADMRIVVATQPFSSDDRVNAKSMPLLGRDHASPLRRYRVAVAGAALALGLGGALSCGDSPSAPAPPPPPPPPPPPVAVPASVSMTPPTASIGPGDTLRLSAEAFDANGNQLSEAQISWSSSDAAIATVDASGLVLGIDEGASTITAVAGEAQGTSEIMVVSADRAALVVLYEATDGPRWVNSEKWLTDAPLRDWYGVEVDGSARVVSLDLSGRRDSEGQTVARHGLTGTIPPQLASLVHLVSLNLGGNDLTGPIPPQFGSLTNIESMNLGRSNLSGSIPAELGALASLKSLDLGSTNFSGSIPRELGELASLERLLLGGANLSGPIPSELGNLAGLESLSLEGNRLGGSIPPELGDLAKLRRLGLGGNELTGSVPPELGRLENLEELDIGGTRLAGVLPREFLKLERLKSLRGRSDHGLCVPGVGPFAAWVGGLESFDGSYCNEPDIAALESLHESTGGPNWRNSTGWLGGPALAEWFGVGADSLGRVTTLDLADNGLAGELPSGLGRLSELAELRIGDNDALTGRLPLSLTGLALSTLHYAGTDLCAPVDDSFRQWLNKVSSREGTGVECARLSDRDILGILYRETGGPSWTDRDGWLTDAPLGEWSGVDTDDAGRVVGLDLVVRGLKGQLPPELGGLTHLRSAYFSINELTGPIPPELGDLADLLWLDLIGNDLTGPIPPELGRLAMLQWLSLGWNDLTGPIPPELGDLANLNGLFLSGNDLTGPIPPELGGLVNLHWLDLERNDLTGPIPPELGGLVPLEEVLLAGNNLSGPIPPPLSRLSRLQKLRLADNELSGSLPAGFGSLASLRELDLTNNAALSGALPASLADLRDVEALLARGTGLCAPDDADFRAWLAGIRETEVAPCAGALAYLTQAVQSREFPVPLVAGEEALLRVFVTSERASGEGMPLVRARLHLDGAEAHAIDISGTSDPIPAEIDESDLSKSTNAVIPPEFVRPGLEMVIEVDPEGTLDPALGVVQRIPPTGMLGVEVREVPRLDLTVIPFLWSSEPDSSVIGIAEAMSAEGVDHALLQETLALLPVAEIEVTAHAPATSSSNNIFDVIGETAAIQALEGGAGYYMGMMASFSRWRGLAAIGGEVSVSTPDVRVVAHELGHNLNLRHAPCGGAGSPDPRYPYPDGSIGAWGYDFTGEHEVVRGGGLVEPWRYDLMGYCGELNWVSDYHFTRAFRHRLRVEDAAGAGADAAGAVRSILVWGGVDPAGVPFLEPAFVVDAPPALPDSAGEHTVVGRAADGAELFSLRFAMPEIAEGGSYFAFTVPVEPDWDGSLATVALSGPSGAALLDGNTDRPMAILREPGSGRVRGFVRNLSKDVRTAAAAAVAVDAGPGLRVLFSRGIPDDSTQRR